MEAKTTNCCLPFHLAKWRGFPTISDVYLSSGSARLGNEAEWSWLGLTENRNPLTPAAGIASASSGVYNGAGPVNHKSEDTTTSARRERGSRASAASLSKTLDAAPGALTIGMGTKPWGFFQGFVLSGFFGLVLTKARLLNPWVERRFHQSSIRSRPP